MKIIEIKLSKMEINKARIYCCLAVTLLITACSNTETILPEADAEIGFGVAMSTTKRSLISDAVQMGTFKVWGWRTPQNQVVKGNVFNGTNVSYDATDGWTYSPLQSWVLYNDYDFYALYPDTLSGANYNETGQLTFDRLDIRQSGEYSTDYALDVMHARQAVTVATTPPDRVLLTFDHLLTNVNFKLLKSTENAADKIVVTGIVVGGMNCIGSMVNDEWIYHDTETSYFYSLPNQELKTDVPLIFGNLLMIPQILTEDQPVTFIVQYNYTQAGSNETQRKYLLTNLPTSQAWTKNTNVTYNATIYVDKNISFSTPVVESWGTEQVAGTIVIK